MMMSQISAVSVLSALLVAASACAGEELDSGVSDTCSFDSESMLGLDRNAFDQDANGWRRLAARKECRASVADLIRDYMAANDDHAPILIFHEAQMRAMAGQTSAAIALFLAAKKTVGRSDRIGWNHYVDATVAFLEKDGAALERSRQAVAKTPKPNGFDPVDVNGDPVDLIWPPNLNVVDGLIKCFCKSYAEAYGHCSGPLESEDGS